MQRMEVCTPPPVNAVNRKYLVAQCMALDGKNDEYVNINDLCWASESSKPVSVFHFPWYHSTLTPSKVRSTTCTVLCMWKLFMTKALHFTHVLILSFYTSTLTLHYITLHYTIVKILISELLISKLQLRQRAVFSVVNSELKVYLTPLYTQPSQKDNTPTVTVESGDTSLSYH